MPEQEKQAQEQNQGQQKAEVTTPSGDQVRVDARPTASEARDKAAPADAHVAHIGAKPDEKAKEHAPSRLLSDQPSFPPPVAVPHERLREAGVAHHYAGVGSESQLDDVQDGVFSDE